MPSQYSKIQIRRGTSSELSASTVVLASGEPAFSIDTNTLKIGDGSNTWSGLGEIGNGGGGSVASDKITEGDSSVEVTDTGSDGHVDFATQNTLRWEITSAGHLLPSTTEDYDIGSADRKVRHLFLSDNSVYMGDNGNKIGVLNDELTFTRQDEQVVNPTMKVSVPQSSTETAKAGSFSFDAQYFYVCFEENKWARLPISTFETVFPPPTTTTAEPTTTTTTADPGLTAPTNLAMSVCNDGDGTISWDAVSGAASYRLQISTDDSSWSLFSDTSNTSALWGSNGTSRYFRVAAINSGGTVGTYSSSIFINCQQDS